MTENQGAEHNLDVIYTLTPHFGMGVHVATDTDDDITHIALAANGLLWRGNYPDAQANIFLLSGVGYSEDDHTSSALAYAGIETDWENRRFYTQYQNRYLYAGDVEKNFEQKVRLGVAPYIGEAGELHTWLIFQADHTPEEKENITLTPLVRMFYTTHLMEIGSSLDGDFLFNYTYQF